ncbi:hypothetical protein SCYAM73S_01312 [Streptomyces cyaneofuscatus]
MPDTSARSRFCTTARIRRPSGVVRRIAARPATHSSANPRMNSLLVARLTPATETLPVSRPGAVVCTFGAPKMSRANCWSIRETPQVTSRVSSGRVYSRRISSHSRSAPIDPATRKATGRARSSETPASPIGFWSTYVV